MLCVPTGILLVILKKLPLEVYRQNFRIAVKWGFWLSVFLVAIKVGTRNAVSREVLEGFATFTALVGESIFLLKLMKKISTAETKDLILNLAVPATVVALFLYHGFEIWLLPVGAMTAALGDYFSADFLLKILGFCTGVIFAAVSSFLIYKAAAALNETRLKFVFAVQMAACIIQQLIILIQILMARGILTDDIWLDVMAPIINHSSWLIFVIFVAVLIVPITLFSQPRPNKLPEYNPAQYRSVLAKALRKRRWGFGVIFALIVMTTASTAGSYVANKKAEIVPAVPVQASNGVIDVALDKVNDGHLHRFVYHASSGEQVRYIVILKGGSAYGVGLDACEICGATGYYERENQVICKLCDVQMNKATIGTRGGCNPIPIEYRIEEGNLRVAQSELEKNAKIFR